jgi:hypothetical protein
LNDAQRSRICAVGAFHIRHAWQQMLNIVTKDKNLFWRSIVNIKLEQIAEQRTER